MDVEIMADEENKEEDDEEIVENGVHITEPKIIELYIPRALKGDNRGFL